MNQYITGTVIKELRERNNLTQAELAMQLNVSDKTVSKWENAKGYPDITLLEPIAKTLGVSITELLSGNPIYNMNVSGNMIRSKLDKNKMKKIFGMIPEIFFLENCRNFRSAKGSSDYLNQYKQSLTSKS